MQFQHRAVADLAWTIASPPLLCGMHQGVYCVEQTWCDKELSACMEQLIALDKQPAPLYEHLKRHRSYRLGRYFEALLAYYFKITPHYEVIDQHAQIIVQEKVGQRTLGELDFVLRDLRSNAVIHLEVAAKFFMAEKGHTSDPLHCIGIHRAEDSLGLKAQHMLAQQCQLSVSAYEAVAAQCGVDIDQRWAMMKGRLFYPFLGRDSADLVALMSAPIAGPMMVNSAHLNGLWFERGLSVQALIDDGLYIEGVKVVSMEALNKLDWFAPWQHMHFEATARLGAKIEQPTCYALMNEQGEEALRVLVLSA